MRYPLHLTIFIFCNYLQSFDFSVCKVNHFFLKYCNSQLFLYFCNKIFKIGVPDSRGMLYYEQSRIIKTRKMMKRTTSLLLCLVLSISLFAQSRGMTFQVHNETLTSVLKKIEKAGEKNILFAYQATDQYHVTANSRLSDRRKPWRWCCRGNLSPS